MPELKFVLGLTHSLLLPFFFISAHFFIFFSLSLPLLLSPFITRSFLFIYFLIFGSLQSFHSDFAAVEGRLNNY